GLWSPGRGVAMGRLQGHGRAGQGAAHARQRPRSPGLDDFQRPRPHLLRTLDVQAARGGTPRRPGRAAGAHDGQRHVRMGRGAEDNASGVAAVLGAAGALVRSEARPRRTLLFVSTTAEESGLLGGEAYVRDPLVPLERTAAVLNLDVVNVRGATRDIDALGID